GSQHERSPLMSFTTGQLGNAGTIPGGDVLDVDQLTKSLRRPRSFISFLFVAITTVLTLSALLPLFSVIYMLVVRGLSRLSVAALTNSSGDLTGAFGNAIVGTIAIVAMAALIAVPIGVMA